MQDAGENGAASGHLSAPGEELPVSHNLQCFPEAFKRKARLYVENDSSIDKHMHENLKISVCLLLLDVTFMYLTWPHANGTHGELSLWRRSSGRFLTCPLGL